MQATIGWQPEPRRSVILGAPAVPPPLSSREPHHGRSQGESGHISPSNKDVVGERRGGGSSQRLRGLVVISHFSRGARIRDQGDRSATTHWACGISPASFSPKRETASLPAGSPRAPPGRRQTGKFYSKNANQRSTPSDLDAERRYTTHKRFARPLYLSKSSPPAGADLSSHRGLAPTQLTRASASTPPHPPGRNLRREVSREVSREASRCPTP